MDQPLQIDGRTECSRHPIYLILHSWRHALRETHADPNLDRALPRDVPREMPTETTPIQIWIGKFFGFSKEALRETQILDRTPVCYYNII